MSDIEELQRAIRLANSYIKENNVNYSHWQGLILKWQEEIDRLVKEKKVKE